MMDDRPAKGSWCPGNYYNFCSSCGSRFIGDKRSATCADCAYGTKINQSIPELKLWIVLVNGDPAVAYPNKTQAEVYSTGCANNAKVEIVRGTFVLESKQ